MQLRFRFLLPFSFYLTAFYWRRDQSMHLAILIFLHLRVRTGNVLILLGIYSPGGRPFHLSFNQSLNVTCLACNTAMLTLPTQEICPFLLCWDFNWKHIHACFIEMVDKEDLICLFFLSSLCLMFIREDKGILTRKANWQTECRECVQLWLEPPFYCAIHKVTADDVPHKQQKWGY